MEAQAQRSYYEITDFDGGDAPIVYLQNPQLRVPLEAIGSGQYRFTLPALAQKTEIWLINPSKAVKEIAQISPRTFEDYRNARANFIIISHQNLRKDVQGRDNVEEYAAYRRSGVGGGYEVLIADVQQIFDQFGYGVADHPQALCNFGAFLKKYSQPKYILLIGHGIEYNLLRQRNTEMRPEHFIPTFGTPGSDNLLFAPNGKLASFVPIGRLAVLESGQIRDYLNKLKEYDQALDGPRDAQSLAWRKRVLHISGGNVGGNEIGTFQARLQRSGAVLRNNDFGAIVTTVSKQSAETVVTSTAEEIISAVNAGVAIKVFLGHGAVTNTDFGLDDPFLFNNTGRYPLIFSLGCLTGKLYDRQNSLSERFILTPKHGGIGYIASSGFANDGALEFFLTQFYQALGGPNYLDGVGDMTDVARRSLEGINSFIFRSMGEQLSFHGDPAVRLNRYKGPDFTPDLSSFRLQPEFQSKLNNIITESVPFNNQINNVPTRYLYNNNRIFRAVFVQGVVVAVFDPFTGQPWYNSDGPQRYGSINGNDWAFIFATNTAEQRKKVIQFVEEVVPKGHYVLFMTVHDEGQSIQDSTLRTPAQLDYWRVHYEGLGDAVLRLGAAALPDTIEQGQPLSLRLPIYNLGNGRMDSVNVLLTLTDAQNRSTVQRFKTAGILALDSFLLSTNIETRNFQGLYQVQIELNPERKVVELNYQNNLALGSFFVRTDRAAPLVDVTFDGLRILHKDLVSAEPFINISLRDENKFLLLEDTSLFEVRVLPPQGSPILLRFNQGSVRFIPAEKAGQSARIEWQPQFVLDGEYQLPRARPRCQWQFGGGEPVSSQLPHRAGAKFEPIVALSQPLYYLLSLRLYLDGQRRAHLFFHPNPDRFRAGSEGDQPKRIWCHACWHPFVRLRMGWQGPIRRSTGQWVVPISGDSQRRSRQIDQIIQLRRRSLF